MALLGVKISKLARRSCFLPKEHSLAEHVSFLIEFGTKSEIKKHLFGRRVMFFTKIWNNHSGKHLDPPAHSRFLVYGAFLRKNVDQDVIVPGILHEVDKFTSARVAFLSLPTDV